MQAQSKNSETELLGDAVKEALAWHDGNARATIETLLLDCEFLREQLHLANGCISRGLTRGWYASAERSTGKA